jgi:hypothetical protein
MSPSKKLITLKQAVNLLNEAHGVDPYTDGRNAFNIGSLYNAISKKKLKRFGPRHLAQVDQDDVLRIFGPQRSA